MGKKNFCAVIPAFNEEKVITASLRSLKKVFKKEDIYVVSDGSTDKTVELALTENVIVLELPKNVGKAMAQEKLIRYFKLTQRYNYILFSDADSQIDKSFLSQASKYLAQKPALIVGTVKSQRRGLVSAFRTYEYGLSHRVYKTAQNFVQAITVAPGCASLYRSDVLEQLNLKQGTLTEDFDLTIQIHKKKLGKVVYAKNAIVATQDPKTIRDYWRQVLRWNTGTWQNYFLHQLYKLNTKFNIELNFLFFDNFLWVATLVMLILYANIVINLLFGLFITIYLCALVVALIEKKYWIIPYIPFFPIFYVVNITSYFYALIKVVFAHSRPSWNKVDRYQVRAG